MTEYKFDPTKYKFEELPNEFRYYWGSGKKWWKVTEKSKDAIWFTVCHNVMDGDDRWKFYSAVATNNQTGIETSSSHVIYRGCITNESFATELLTHLLGTCRNDGVVHGRRRLEANSLDWKI